MNQIKRIKNLIHIYQALDEQRKGKMELMAKGLLKLQILADGEKQMPEMRKSQVALRSWWLRSTTG